MKKSIFLLAMVLNIFVATADDGAASQYNYVSDFDSGIAVGYHVDGKYYLVDEDLTKISKRGFDQLTNFERGWEVTSFHDGAKSGFVNRKGEIVAGVECDAIHVINHWLFECTQGDSYFLASTDGTRIDDKQYDELQYITSNRLFLAKSNNMWVTLDHEGKALMDSGFECLLMLEDGFLAAYQEEQWYEVGDRGDKIRKIDLSSRVKLNKWSLGLLQAVRRCVIVDEDMKVISDRYDDVLELNDTGLSRFRIGSKMGYVDGRGRELVAEEECLAGEFKDGAAIVRYPVTSQCRVYNRRGKEAFDATKFDYLEDFKNGCSIVREQNADLFGIIDSRGKWLCQPAYEKIVRDPSNFRDFLATYDGVTMKISKNGELKEAITTK